MEEYNTRLVFLDSTNNSNGTGGDAQWAVNDTDSFTVRGDHRTMKVGMNSFSMYRNFYNINSSNNIFWIDIQNSAGVYITYPAYLPVGDYTAFRSNTINPIVGPFLEDAISIAIAEVLTTSLPGFFGVVTPGIRGETALNPVDVATVYDDRLRIFRVFYSERLTAPTAPDPPFPNMNGGAIRFFTIKPSLQSAQWATYSTTTINNITYNEAPIFQDTYAIMGGVTNYTEGVFAGARGLGTNFVVNPNAKNGYDSFTTLNGDPMPYAIGGELIGFGLTGTSVAQLSTLDQVVIRTNMPSQNYQSSGIDATISNQLGLSPTNILARIPIDDTTFDEVRGIIHFIDHNDNFYLMLGSSQLTNIRISLTDGRGRPLVVLGEDAQQSANLNFRMTLKIDYIILPSEREKLLLNAERMSLYPINLGRG